MISRRDALKLGAIGTMVLSNNGWNSSTYASQTSPSTWNWAGNAGHTGEMPGPGLDLDGPLGERWRIPRAWDGKLAGLVDDTLFITRGHSGRHDKDSWCIEAYDLSNGSLTWSRNAPGFETYSASGSSTSTSVPPGEGVTFNSAIAAYQNTVILTMSDNTLWALDSRTGDELWLFDVGYEIYFPPTIIGNRALCHVEGKRMVLIELEPSPTVDWDVEINGFNQQFLGADEKLAWITSSEGTTALDIETGLEYWRLSSDHSASHLRVLGIAQGFGIQQSIRSQQIWAIDGEGALAWSIDDSLYNDNQKVVINDTIARFTPTSSTWSSCIIQCLAIEDGTPRWNFELLTNRWANIGSSYAICDGIAYYALADQYEGDRVLLAIDPVAEKVRGLRGTNLDPELVSAGVMISIDLQTEEFVCVGTVSGTLRPGGRARVIQESTLFGAPSTSSIDRGKVKEGTELDIVGDLETTESSTWYPISIPNSKTTGWLPADSLVSLDGDIVFEPMEITDFGIITKDLV